jgi:pyruvate dehydrogenase E1 component beta subunit
VGPYPLLPPIKTVQTGTELKIQKTQYPVSSKIYAPCYFITIHGAPEPVITITTYGYMADLASQAAIRLAYEHEIFVELVIPTQLSPFEQTTFLTSVERTGKLLIVEEGNLQMGWGAEIAARTIEKLGSQSVRLRRLAALDLPVAASGPLESSMLPDVNSIIQAVQLMV